MYQHTVLYYNIRDVIIVKNRINCENKYDIIFYFFLIQIQRAHKI